MQIKGNSMITTFLSSIIAIIGTGILCMYFLYRMKNDDKVLFGSLALTFFVFILRFMNEWFIFIFIIFPISFLQKIQYVLYLFNITMFFIMYLTFLQVRKKYKINKILIGVAVIFSIIFGIILSFLEYPPAYDYEALFPISMIFFIYAISTVVYATSLYLIKERENPKREKGVGYIFLGILIMVFGEMIFSPISISVTYFVYIIGLGFLFVGFSINSMIKYVDLLDYIEARVMIFDYYDKLVIMNENTKQFFINLDSKYTQKFLIGKRILEIFSLLGIVDYEKQLYQLKMKKEPIVLSNKKIKLGKSEEILNIGFHPFIFNENGDITKYIILINEITKITEAIMDEKMSDSQQIKIKIFKMLNEELRTPLYMIDGYTKSLKNSILKLKNQEEKDTLLNDMKVIEKDLASIFKLLKKIYSEK